MQISYSEFTLYDIGVQYAEMYNIQRWWRTLATLITYSCVDSYHSMNHYKSNDVSFYLQMLSVVQLAHSCALTLRKWKHTTCRCHQIMLDRSERWQIDITRCRCSSVNFLHLSDVPGCTMPRNESGRARVDWDASQAPVRVAVCECHMVDERHAQPHVHATPSSKTLRSPLRPVHRNRAKSRRSFTAIRLVRAIADVA